MQNNSFKMTYIFVAISAASLFIYVYADNFLARNILEIDGGALIIIYHLSNVMKPVHIVLFVLCSSCLFFLGTLVVKKPTQLASICRRFLKISIYAALSGFIAAIICSILKNIHRERPFIHFYSNIPEIIYRKEAPFNSFPSGHSAAIFVIATSILIFYPKLSRYIIPTAIFFASTRFLCGVHYVSDVVVGAGIGILCPIFLLSIQNTFLGRGYSDNL